MHSSDQQRWRRYLTTFHSTHAGITEQLFNHLDSSPYEWLVQPLLHDETGLILDLACGSAPTRAQLPRHRWVGMDTSPAELAAAAATGRGPLVRAQAGGLPLPDRSVRAVCAAMCLQVITPLTQTLGEVSRVLQPGGTLTALVPARLGLNPAGWLGWLRVLRAVGVLDPPWPNPGARDGLAQILRNHGFTIRADERRTFTLRLLTPDTMALLIDSLYLPDTDPNRIAKAKHILAGWTRPGRQLPLPLRRVIAQTTTS
jgi:SAM-dependent methyltransferase